MGRLVLAIQAALLMLAIAAYFALMAWILAGWQALGLRIG